MVETQEGKGKTMKVLLAIGLLVLAGCNQNERYQIVPASTRVTPLKTLGEVEALIPDIGKIKQKTNSNKEAALLEAREKFYDRCIEEIRWASGKGFDEIHVWYFHGSKEDHAGTLKKLTDAGYKLNHWTDRGVLIKWGSEKP